MLKTEAVRLYLRAKTYPDLSELYHHDMELQVNVAQDGGTRVDGEFRGREWHGWTDGDTTWKPMRIPLKANTEPEYNDSELKYDLSAHAEGIGMTGWNWKDKVSKWVAFDFDAISGHSEKHTKKMTSDELDRVQISVSEIPWVTVRKSTSGKGLHLYVFTPDVPTATHNEHAALARAIIAKMSAIAGYDFVAKVDNCGHIMWVWHRKMTGTDGLSVLKAGRCMTDDEVPLNWRDHIAVVSTVARRAHASFISQTDLDPFEELCSKRPVVQLDDDHKKLITWLGANGCVWWWDADRHLLVTHTLHLKEAYEVLGMKGTFDTTSSHSSEQNCYCAPLRRGAWLVRRFTPGVQEHESWSQDTQGWTRCFLNREPDIKTACRTNGGLEDKKRAYHFREACIATKALSNIGIQFVLPSIFTTREAKVYEAKDGRIVMEVDRKGNDSGVEGWLPDNKVWTKVFSKVSTLPDEPEVGSYDDVLRHVVTCSDEDYGWVIKTDGVWRGEPLQHIRLSLQSLGIAAPEIPIILGSGVMKPWKAVCKPFQPEYPGDREWNRNVAQMRFHPTKDLDNLQYPTWTKILAHCGAGLDDAIGQNAWCRANGVLSGGDYLKCWIASIFQEPTEPLPYIFLYGPQNSGKSIFHEALTLLLTKGCIRADAALINSSGFNGELEGAILCVIEETELKRDKTTYNRMKDWVTSKELLIHAKGKTPYHIVNTSHWIQTSNEATSCPIFSGDTRVTVGYVPALDVMDLIPKKQLLPMLEKEAPDFLAEIMSLSLPPSNDRLNVPVIISEEKAFISELAATPLERFIREHCKFVPGMLIKFSDFVDRFNGYCDPEELRNWGKRTIGQNLPPEIAKGHAKRDNQLFLGNIAWANVETKIGPRWVVRDSFLEVADDKASP